MRKETGVKNLGLIDYLYIFKPIYMTLLFAVILFACKDEDAEMAEGASKYDTTQAAKPYGETGPTAEPNREMNSGDLEQNATFTHVFSEEGEFPYFCRYHGGPKGMGMAGVARVTAGGTPRTHRVTISEYDYPDLDLHVGDTVVFTNATSVVHTIETDF